MASDCDMGDMKTFAKFAYREGANNPQQVDNLAARGGLVLARHEIN